jgi:aminoglycoside 6'-N-acetyltransferase
MIQLCNADISDLQLLRHWDNQLHIMAANLHDDWCWKIELEQTPQWHELPIAEYNGRTIGFVQIIDPSVGP